MIAPDQLNTYDVLVSDDIVFTRAALEDFLAGPTRGKSASASALESEAAVIDEPAETGTAPKAKKAASPSVSCSPIPAGIGAAT